MSKTQGRFRTIRLNGVGPHRNLNLSRFENLKYFSGLPVPKLLKLQCIFYLTVKGYTTQQQWKAKKEFLQPQPAMSHSISRIVSPNPQVTIRLNYEQQNFIFHSVYPDFYLELRWFLFFFLHSCSNVITDYQQTDTRYALFFFNEKKWCIGAYGHTTLETRHPVRSVKLSNDWPR